MCRLYSFPVSIIEDKKKNKAIFCQRFCFVTVREGDFTWRIVFCIQVQVKIAIAWSRELIALYLYPFEVISLSH